MNEEFCEKLKQITHERIGEKSVFIFVGEIYPAVITVMSIMFTHNIPSIP